MSTSSDTFVEAAAQDVVRHRAPAQDTARRDHAPSPGTRIRGRGGTR
jgi:hypothetical protein